MCLFFKTHMHNIYIFLTGEKFFVGKVSIYYGNDKICVLVDNDTSMMRC